MANNVGKIVLWASSTLPSTWKVCDGQLLSISSYGDLYDLVGTTFGGNGTTNFGVPDLTAPNTNMEYGICATDS